jgi:phosphate ABC transporter phosphate-binding protein
MKAIVIRARGAWPARPAVRGRGPRRLRLVMLCLSLVLAFAAIELGAVPFSPLKPVPAKAAGNYTPITGAGSTWAYPAIHAWIDNMNQFGIQVNYQPNGSSSGRTFFANGTADWAASEIPYGVVDGNNSDSPPKRGFVYMPDVAGGTTLMYNLQINGQKVTNLRLSGKTVADIFTNKVTYWDDPEVKADNPQLALPHLGITPVVRSDGSGATADFTQWMLATNASEWQAYCGVVGRSPCTQTSTFPVQGGTAMIGQPGDPGVATYVAQASSNGAIGYVEYSWALQEGFPVAKLLNAAGYYTLPSPGHVAVSLLQDQVNTDSSNSATYLTQNLSGVYTNTDPRNYELSAYSYFILPTDLTNQMTTTKGNTIGTFGQYALCLGQSQVDVLGYSALPINLVQDGFNQLAKIPGYTVSSTPISTCNNPTFSTNGTNTLAVNDPQPLACDKQGSTQCAQGVAEPTETGAQTGTSGAGSGTTGGATTSGGSSTSGSNTSGSNTSGSNTSGSNTSGSNTSGGNKTSTNSPTGGATVTSPTGGASASTGTTGTGKSCDVNTGICSTSSTSNTGTGTNTTGTGTTGTGTTGTTDNSEVGNGGSGQAASDSPITLAGSNGSGLEVTLMALAAGMMFLLSVVPPLLAQAGKRSRQRRGIDEFYDRNDWPGDGR